MGWTKERRDAHSKIISERWKNPTPAMLDGIKRATKKRQRQWTPARRKAQARYAVEICVNRRDPKKNAEQLRAALASRWSRPEAHEYQAEATSRLRAKWQREGRLHVRPSRPQREMMKMIRAARITGFRYEVQVWRYSLDIADRKRKLCIEVDGEYWHKVNKTDYGARDLFLRERGWTIYRTGTSSEELRNALAWLISKL